MKLHRKYVDVDTLRAIEAGQLRAIAGRTSDDVGSFHVDDLIEFYGDGLSRLVRVTHQLVGHCDPLPFSDMVLVSFKLVRIVTLH